MSNNLFWRCETETLDATHDHTLGDTIAAAGTGGSLSATAARVGTNGILSAASQVGGYTLDAAGIWPSAATPGSSAGSAAYSFQYPTAVPGSGLVNGLRAQGTTTTNQIGVETSGTANLRLKIGNATTNIQLATTSAALTFGAWYGVVIRWDLANDKRCIEVYSAAGALIEKVEDVATDLNAYIPAEALANIKLGIKGSNWANDIWFDNFMVDDDYDAPLQEKLTITSYTEYAAISYVQYRTMVNPLLRM